MTGDGCRVTGKKKEIWIVEEEVVMGLRGLRAAAHALGRDAGRRRGRASRGGGGRRGPGGGAAFPPAQASRRRACPSELHFLWNSQQGRHFLLGKARAAIRQTSTPLAQT